MKNVSTKIAYMVIGSLLTIIGYHFANIDHNAAEAEKEDPIVDEIRCRRLVIVDEDDTPHLVLGTLRQVSVGEDDNAPHLVGEIAIGKHGGKRLLLHPDGIHESVPPKIEVGKTPKAIIETLTPNLTPSLTSGALLENPKPIPSFDKAGGMLCKKGDKLLPFDFGDIQDQAGKIVLFNRNNKTGGRERSIRFIGKNAWIQLTDGTRYTSQSENCIIDLETHTISEGNS
jgi:hypothetical protein